MERRYLKLVFSVLIAFVLSGIFTFLVKYSITPSGKVLREWYVVEEGKKVSLPDYKRVSELTRRTYRRDIEGPYTGYLVLPRPNAQTIFVYLDGRRIFSMGDRNRAANMWNGIIVVPIEVLPGIHSLALELYGNYDIGFLHEIYISENPWSKVVIADFILNKFYSISAGVALGFFIILFMISFSLKVMKLEYLYASLASASAMIYMFDFISKETNLSYDGYLTMKRIYYSLTYLAILFLYGSLEKRNNKTKIFPYFLVVNIAVISVILFSPSFHFAREFHMRALIFLFFMLLAVVYQAFISRDVRFYWIFTFLILMTGHDAFVIMFSINEPFVLGSAVVIAGIAFGLILIEDYKTLYHQMEKVTEKTLRDHLTGIYNRRVASKLRLSGNDAVVFIDIDDFKNINDIFGHSEGDRILRGFVETAKEKIKGEDIIIRYGGDEFVIVLKDCSVEDAKEVVEKIRAAFNLRYGADLSYGIEKYTTSFHEAVEKADKKMYHMKKVKKKKGGYRETSGGEGNGREDEKNHISHRRRA